MARSVAARYLVAAFAFMAAATWLGVGLKGGFECLLVFVLALQTAHLYQRRQETRSRRVRQRQHRPSDDLASTEAQDISPSASASDRLRRAGRVYDGGREGLDWPVPSEATW